MPVADAGEIAAQVQPIGETWSCPGCRRSIGWATPDGRLIVGSISIRAADFNCVSCGYRKQWHRSDKLLEDLLERLGRNRLDGAPAG